MKECKKRNVIISGGSLDEDLVLSVLHAPETDYIIGVDHGLEFLYKHQITPDYIVGDFDSLVPEILEYYKALKQVPIREFNPVKDATDTEIAVRYALEQRDGDLLILGATGTRIDHVIGNIQVLKIAYDAGRKAVILDSHNRIQLVEKEITLRAKEAFGKYFSVFPLGGCIEDFNIKGAKYPLTHHRLTPYDSLCVSNQIEGEQAEICFSEGLVILIESLD